MNIQRIILTICAVFFVTSCGRYLPPILPEDTAPASVEALTAVKAPEGIVLTWTSPSKDRRGKRLKQIDGYKVYKVSIDDVDVTNKPVEVLPFKEAAFIVDTHLEQLKKLQDEAEEKGQITRKVDLPSESKQFQFADKAIIKNKVYYYKVLGINQGSEEGAADSVLRVRVNEADALELLLFQNRLEVK